MFFCNYPLLTFSPKYDLPGPDPVAQTRKMLVCHSCGEMGHKSFNCPKAIQDIVARDGEGKPVEDRKVGWLVVLRLNFPVNNFSVMSGRSHRFLGN